MQPDHQSLAARAARAVCIPKYVTMYADGTVEPATAYSASDHQEQVAQRAAQIIADTYAPLVQENERLRGLLEYEQALLSRCRADVNQRLESRGLPISGWWEQWRTKNPPPFDYQLCELAILDALTQEGVAAWCGDASGCVTQIIEAQLSTATRRAEQAEQERDTFRQRVYELTKPESVWGEAHKATEDMQKRAEWAELLARAARFAHNAHDGQTRKYNGRPYIEHPMRVAHAALMIGLPNEAIVAAWLHDVIEDCGVTAEKLAEKFPAEVVSLVVELTNPSKGSKEPRAVRKAMDREHIAKASRESKILKLLDRIDNIGDMIGCGDKFAALYYSETLLLIEAVECDDQLIENLCLKLGELVASGTERIC